MWVKFSQFHDIIIYANTLLNAFTKLTSKDVFRIGFINQLVMQSIFLAWQSEFT